MKRIIAFGLVLLILFGLVGCDRGPEIPVFSAEELTQAQSYAYAAIHGYEIDRSLCLLSAQVLLTEDVNKAIPNNMITKDWTDVQDTCAIVLAKYGEQKVQESEAEASDDGEAKESELSLVMAFFLNEKMETVAAVQVSGANGSNQAVPAVTEIYMELEATGVSGLRRQLAGAELDAEAFLSENAEQEALAAFAEGLNGVDWTLDALGNEEVLRDTGNDHVCLQYWEKLWGCAVLREVLSRMEQIETLTGSEQYAAQALLESDIIIWRQESDLWKEYAVTVKELADYEAAHGEEIVPLQEAHAAFGADSWWDDETYLRLCIGSDSLNQYDVLLRQQRIYEAALAMLHDAEEETDTTLREYMAEKNDTETTAFSEYSNAIKVYVRCVVNQETFLAENAAELSAYEAAEAAAREAAGEKYADDIEYIKVQITYEDLIQQKNAHESAVTNSKAAADKICTDMEEKIAKVEEKEAECKNGILVAQMKTDLREYLSQTHESVSEYEAGADQWGDLHPDFAAYQNEHLTYIVRKSTYTPNKNTDSGSGGMKYDPNDENYRSHDYDGDGRLSDQEFQDAFNDYVNKILGE